MTKAKEGVQTVENLKAQMSEFLGVDSYMEEEVVKMMEDGFLTNGKENGEDKAEEALKAAKYAMSLIKDDEFKGILISALLVQLPMGIQKTITDLHGKMVDAAIAEHVHKKVEENPLVGLALAASVLKSKMEDE